MFGGRPSEAANSDKAHATGHRDRAEFISPVTALMRTIKIYFKRAPFYNGVSQRLARPFGGPVTFDNAPKDLFLLLFSGGL
jgi:hypothetical protein